MGRSVNYLKNAEYVIYFTINLNDEDEFLNQSNWEDFISNLTYEIKAKLKSYNECTKWDNREVLIFLENELCEIGISEYCDLYSLSIRTKDEDYYYYGYNREILGKYHAQQIRKTLEKCLLNCEVKILNKLGTFSNGEGVYEYAK